MGRVDRNIQDDRLRKHNFFSKAIYKAIITRAITNIKRKTYKGSLAAQQAAAGHFFYKKIKISVQMLIFVI